MVAAQLLIPTGAAGVAAAVMLVAAELAAPQILVAALVVQEATHLAELAVLAL